MPRNRTDSSEGEAATPETDVLATEPPAAETVPATDEPVVEEPAREEEFPREEAKAEPVAEEPTPPPAEVDEPEDVALVAEVDEAIRQGGPVEPEPVEPETVSPVEEPEVKSTPAPVAPAPVHQDSRVEDSGPSFAGRVLTGLILLLAGGGLGIWAAPKLAPMLPSGMEPVAAWLTPGATEAEARIAALEAKFDSDLGAVKAQVAELSAGPEIGDRIAAAVGESETKLTGEITALRDQMGQIDGADTRQRLARVEAAVEGQLAELSAFKQQISAGAVSGSDATAQIDVYRAEVDGLRAEMGALSDKVGGLATRIDEVSAEAKRQVETAQATVQQVQTEATTAVSTAVVNADLAQVRAAIEAGQPFAEPLQVFAKDSGLEIPEGLTAAAASGISSLAQLRDAFGDAAHQAIRSSITAAAAGGGVLARTQAFLQAQIATRSLTPQEGTSPDAVLSRMEEMLRHDDLAGALAEADKLPTEAAQAMSGWLDAARLRANVEAGLAKLTAELSATN